MTVIELKQYIYNNKKIEYILKEIGCHSINYHDNKEYYSCGNYNGDNPTAVNVYNNEYLRVKNWTRTKEFDDNSDLITLVEYNKGLSFSDAIKYLYKLLGLKFSYKTELKQEVKVKDPLEIFKRIKNGGNRTVNVKDMEILDENLLDDYTPILHISWIKEGIMPWTAKKFGIAYSYRRQRIIIPHFHWCTKKLLGFNMRTVVDNYEELGISKYWITPTYQKSNNLYGLAQNYDDIQKAGYVVIAESEKSCLKRDSLCDSTVVSLSGKTISDEQVAILIGLNVEIVVALDKDVDINEVRHICNKFYGVRSVSYIWDKWKLLGEKDSPMDANDKIYKFLFKHRVKYDDSEHRKYLKELGRK